MSKSRRRHCEVTGGGGAVAYDEQVVFLFRHNNERVRQRCPPGYSALEKLGLNTKSIISSKTIYSNYTYDRLYTVGRRESNPRIAGPQNKRE